MSDSGSLTEAFGPLISEYSRAQALEDGVLVDVTETAREAGFHVPVAITAALHADISSIPPSKSYQDYAGRLWDVLYMGRVTALCRVKRGESTIRYRLILHVGRRTYYTVKMTIGPGDDGAPVITLMRPDED